MKKQIRIWLAAMCIGVLLAAFSLSSQAVVSFGDVDGDGHIFAADARLVHRANAGLVPWTQELLAAGDTDGNNVLTMDDVHMLLRLAAGYGNEDDSCIDGMEGAILKGITKNHYKIYEINGITYIDGILIANKTYPLPSDYAPGDLLSECRTAFEKMAADAYNEAGLDLRVLSGYRSYSTQSRLYDNYVATDGKDVADTYSARPGHSEHQSGLALDVNSIADSFEGTPEALWLAENCHKYGFILRYPKGKTQQTGYIYEAWHIRYVGEKIAAKIFISGLCLEEFYGIDSHYNY